MSPISSNIWYLQHGTNDHTAAEARDSLSPEGFHQGKAERAATDTGRPFITPSAAWDRVFRGLVCEDSDFAEKLIRLHIFDMTPIKNF